MPRTFRLALAAVALAGVVAPAAAYADPEPPCRLTGGPQVEYHDGRPVVVVYPYEWVC